MALGGLTGVTADWIVQGGAVGLLGLVALMIFLGRLVPRSVYQQLERDRDYWRTAALQAIGQTELLLPAAQITTAVTKQLADIHAGEAVEAALARRVHPPPQDGGPA